MRTSRHTDAARAVGQCHDVANGCDVANGRAVADSRTPDLVLAAGHRHQKCRSAAGAAGDRDPVGRAL